MLYSYQVELAIRAATLLHKDQIRKGSVPLPYISHLMAVAIILLDYTQQEDTLIIAFLHDTLEDTGYTEAELRTDFGDVVADAVASITEPRDTAEKVYTWKERKEQYIKQLQTAPESALLVAAADKIHNMRSIVEEYDNDPVRFRRDFAGAPADRLATYDKIVEVISQRLASPIVDELQHVFTQYELFMQKIISSTAPTPAKAIYETIG